LRVGYIVVKLQLGVPIFCFILIFVVLALTRGHFALLHCGGPITIAPNHIARRRIIVPVIFIARLPTNNWRAWRRFRKSVDTVNSANFPDLPIAVSFLSDKHISVSISDLWG
jgi:hypothetical protein